MTLPMDPTQIAATAPPNGADEENDRLAVAPEPGRRSIEGLPAAMRPGAAELARQESASERRVRRAAGMKALESSTTTPEARSTASEATAGIAPPGPTLLLQSLPGTASSNAASSLGADARAAEAALLERLNLSLTQWVDDEKARAYVDRPSDLLRAVARQRHRVVPDPFPLTLDATLLDDEAILDEAAVLHERLRRPVAAAGSSPSAPSLAALRASFVEALRADYAKRRMLDALLAPSSSLGQTTPHFDGFALRNAEGKSFDDLLGWQPTWADPAVAALNRDQRRALLAEKFDEMAESTQFPIGSIAHSLATAALRIDRYGGAAPSPHADEAALVRAFMRQEDAWRAGAAYPYQPRLLFAMHLARSSGYEVVSPDDLRLIYENQVSDPALELMASGDSVPAQWLARHLSDWEARGVYWKTAAPAVQAQVLLESFDALRAAADEHGPVATFAQSIRDKGMLTPNRIVGVDLNARAVAVLEYANERLLVAYGRPPAFDRRQAADAILRRLGADGLSMTDERDYVIVGDNTHVTKAAYGDIVDEFLDRADWVGLNGSSMTLGSGVRLTPRAELEREEEAFNERLQSDPWVVAMAKERLRAQSKATTPEAVRRVCAQIAGNFAAETEGHRALVKGLDTWVNTIPIVGPIYNIEEGVRHKDAARAAFGLLFLGADGFDLTTGAGRGARPEAVHPVVPKLRRVSGRVDCSTGNAAGHHEMIEMSVDPAHIARPDADVPEPLRALARQARGQRNVRWRDYDVVHLDEEDLIVPVRREGEVYLEVDWRTGHRLRDAPRIELDPGTSRGRRLHGDEHAQARAPGDADVRERLTVERVTHLLKRANDLKRVDFDTAFAESFALKPPAFNASRFDAPAFYRKLYDSSETFRRLFNRHAELDACARNGTAARWKKWEFVIGEAGPLGPPRKAYTDFEHKRIYIPTDDAVRAMTYVGAAGPQAMTSEQVYLHEAIHALTGARDPEPELDMMNRGPVVYLTDKILCEAGYAIPEQIMYRRTNSSPEMPIDQTVAFQADAAARTAARENRYLDPLVDAKRTIVQADALVEGVPVASRPTVARTNEVLRRSEVEDGEVFLGWRDFRTKFDKNFGFYVQDRNMTTSLAADSMVIIDFYGRLYHRSVTFRRMFDKMPVTDATQADPWKFVLEGDLEFDAMSPGGRAHGVNETSKKIYVLDDGARYLTESGLRDVEIERKLACQMISALTGLPKLSATEGLLNRGAAVFLTDRVLKEAGFNYPRQLVGALVGPDDAAAQAALLARQTQALRSATAEDRYLLLGSA
ncbi:MAG: PipA/GogA/GtgA family type III secretion system effector [Burkholderiales bacterium]|nr:PipA/GogA/GtgA family type III secretion system effector [Burkholderiales bacterium]